MRRRPARKAAFLLIAPLILAGCGDRSLILTVDVLSFLDPGDVSQSYNVPGGVPTTTMDLASESVNLLPGVEDVTEIASATLHIEASFDNQTGTADGTLLIYIASADSTDPFATTPVASVPVTLTPANVTNVSTDVTSAAVAEALVQDSARIGVRLTFDSTPTPPLQQVSGTETLTQLQATVITKKNL
jgi:hypothetical protein